MLLCSYVVDRAMERKLWKPRSQHSDSMHWRPCWIQKWGKVDDQSVDSYLIFGSLRNTQNPRDALVTLHPRRQSGGTESAGHNFLASLTAVACLLGIVGIFVTVAGTRSLHWSVSAAQLAQTVFMVLLRAYIRRKINAVDVRAVKLPRRFEIEWLVTRSDELWAVLEDWDRKGRKFQQDDLHFGKSEAN